jgi:hypothetical protein
VTDAIGYEGAARLEGAAYHPTTHTLNLPLDPTLGGEELVAQVERSVRTAAFL